MVRLGPKPGSLDRLLGADYSRSKTINGVRVSTEDPKYQKFCEEAYEFFESEHEGDLGLFRKKLAAINTRYRKILSGAKQDDKIKWLEVFAKSVLLTNAATEFVKKINPSVVRMAREAEGLSQQDRSRLTSAASQQTNTSFPTKSEPAQHFPSTHGTEFRTSQGTTRVALPHHEEMASKPIEAESSSYLASSVVTVGDALSSLNAMTGGVPYGILVFVTSIVAKLPPKTTGAAIAVRSVIGANAFKIGDKELKTTLYCGPNIDCSALRTDAKAKGIELLEFDEKRKMSEVVGAERVIISTHGSPDGSQWVHNAQYLGAQSSMQPDDFAAKYFPDARIIHALGCSLGADVEKNFKENALKPNQVLFLHAGGKLVAGGIAYDARKFLVLENNSKFPLPDPVQIIFKQDQ